MAYVPSQFALRIFEEYEGTNSNILVNAVAGSGKTTTIVELAKRTPRDKRVVFLAFNRDIVTELKAKLSDYPNIDVRTLHSFGMSELRYRFAQGGRKVEVDDGKVSQVIVALADGWGPFLDDDGFPSEAERTSYCARVEKIVDIARFSLPKDRTEMLELCERFDVPIYNGEIERAKEVLKACNAVDDRFDFVDMIYRPALGAMRKGWRLRQYDVVIVDECQDLNRAQQEILRHIVAPGGRLVAVGDPGQAIYGFAGASIDSFEELKRLLPNTVELPLSVCYRCDDAIIRHAQQRVPHIEARPGAGSGEVRQASVAEIVDGDFVMCRNTRPLVALCLQLIAKGQRATIKGSDIGRSLVRMVRNTKCKTLETMNKRLDREVQKLLEKARKTMPFKNPDEVSSVANARDRVEAIRTIAAGFKCKTPEDICTAIQQIFTDESSAGVMLSTVHKAKGLEAERAFVVDAHLMPAKYARRAWEKEQESNLDYVMRTRARKSLLYVNDWTADSNKMAELHRALEGIAKHELA